MTVIQHIGACAVIRVKRLHPDARLPSRGTLGSAGMDLYALEECLAPPGSVEKVRTGIAIAIPPGYEAQIRPRSGMAARGYRIVNAPGTIDSDYRGEVKVLMARDSRPDRKERWLKIRPGMRIAQLVVQRVPSTVWMEVEELDETERGEAGFGSTGE